MTNLDETNNDVEIGEATDVERLDQIPTTLRNLPSGRTPRTVTYRKRKSLPPGYKPGEFDVCCGRGKRHWNHIGNVRFRRIIQSNVERYMDAPAKNDKTAVVVSIVDDIRQMNGCFLKEDLRGNWYDIGDQQAREKVGHSLRDQVSTIHRQKQKQQALHKHHVAVQQQMKLPPGMTVNMGTTGAAGVATAPSPTAMAAPMTLATTTTTSSLSSTPMPFAPPGQLSVGAPPSLSSNALPAFTTTTMDSDDTNMVHSTAAAIMPEPDAALSFSNNNKDAEFNDAVMKVASSTFAVNNNNNNDPVMDYGYAEEEDEGALSDGSNERTTRRSTLSSSMIIDKFARRPSFASAVADPLTNSFVNSFAGIPPTGSRPSALKNSTRMSVRASGWSFLQDLDFNMDQFDQDFQDGLEPLQVKSGGETTSMPTPTATPSSAVATTTTKVEQV